MEAIQNKSNYRVEFRTRWPDGSTHWIHGRGHVVCDEKEGVVRLIGLGIDVSERKQAEKILEVAYDEMEKMVEERTAQLAQTNIALKKEILERKKVEKDILEISQKEQRRWGSQIHDDLCQNLTRHPASDPFPRQNSGENGYTRQPRLKKIEALLNQTISQAKEMSRGLYPVELEADSSCFPSKTWAGARKRFLRSLVIFHCPIPILIDDNNLATHLYRIAQEAIHNAVKHGQAQRIDIHLIKEGKEMSLIIQDDGKGFSEEAKNITGIGFQIMKYRARMIDAELNVRGNNSHGTILTCTFSLPEKSPEAPSLPLKAASHSA